MKLALIGLALFSSIQALAFSPDGAWQLQSWTCASGETPRWDIDHDNDMTLFNLRTNGTYDVVFISGENWGAERGVYQAQRSQLCLEARESLVRERPFWYGRHFVGCAYYERLTQDNLTLRVNQENDNSICRRGDVAVLQYREVSGRSRDRLF